MLDRLVVIFSSATIVFTSLLFFFRTRAVFNTYPWVIAFFGGLWVAVLGGCLAFIVDSFLSSSKSVPVNDPASNTGGTTPICINQGTDAFIVSSIIIPLINDTLVFLAISWRLSRVSYDPYTLKTASGIKFFIFGDYLPGFSKAIFRDGQAYYLSAIHYSLAFVKIAHTLCSFFFFQQDHRYHKHHSSDHVILPFVPYGSSNGFHDSEHRNDECHGQSSIQEYDAIWWLERGRERYFYHPFSRYLKKNDSKLDLWEGELGAVRQKSKQYRDSDELSDANGFTPVTCCTSLD